MLRRLMITAAITGALFASSGAYAQGTVKVGVLHSLTGTMAISEVTVKNATMLAIDEINAAGGVTGKKIDPVVEDGASEPATFAQKAQKLIQEDKVVTVFGGWTSASRKAMLPVFERFQALAVVSGAVRGQRMLAGHHVFGRAAEPADSAGARLGRTRKATRRYLLAGLGLRLSAHGQPDPQEAHRPRTEWWWRARNTYRLAARTSAPIVNKIQAAKPDIIFNTSNGDSNVSFFKQMAAAGLPSAKLPVMSFSIAEPEAKAMGPSLVAGQLRRVELFPDA